MTEENIQKKNFDMGKAIKFGWNIMKTNFWFFFGIIWTAIALSLIPNLPMQIIVRSSRFPNYGFIVIIFFYIISIIISSIVQMGYINIALIFCNGEKPRYSDFFAIYPLVFRYLIASLLYGLIAIGGYILLIIPGIIWSIKFQFFGYFIVEQKCGIIEALKRSAAITKDIKWELLLFGIVLYFINMLGVIALFVGLFAAVPTTLVAYTYVYREILSQTVAEKL